MKVVVTVFSHDRPHHLELMMFSFLLRTDRTNCDVMVLDDDSQMKETKAVLKKLASRGDVEVVYEKSPIYECPQARIGSNRAKAVEYALKGDYDYLLMLDDDIIIGRTTIQEAIADFISLQNDSPFSNVGAMSLHNPIPTAKSSSVVVGGKTYGLFRFGGEANVMLSAKAMKRFGGKFGPGKGGFGDKFFEACNNHGMPYFCRMNPPHNVQHIGVGIGASKCYKEGKMPFWVIDFYTTDYLPKKYTYVKGFDRTWYSHAIHDVGALKAPLHYKRNLKR